MNKKRIEGRRGGASWHHTAKPHGSTCPGGKSDVCAGKQRVVRLAPRPGLSPSGLGTYLGTERSGEGMPVAGSPEGVSASEADPLVGNDEGFRGEADKTGPAGSRNSQSRGRGIIVVRAQAGGVQSPD